jgi:tetratricopeptide (TPR) repeat protein
MRTSISLLFFGFIIFVVVSCSSDGGGPTVKTPDELLKAGWQAYSQKNYPNALNLFSQAISARANFMDAYNGAGWANAKLNQMTDALNQYTIGINADTIHLQIKAQIEAGLAFVDNTQKSYSSSIYWAGQVLQADSNWIFTRDLTVSAADLFILRAEDYFALAKFDSSLLEVQKLDGRDSVNFSANVSTDVGRMALVNEIERLRSIH